MANTPMATDTARTIKKAIKTESARSTTSLQFNDTDCTVPMYFACILRSNKAGAISDLAIWSAVSHDAGGAGIPGKKRHEAGSRQDRDHDDGKDAEGGEVGILVTSAATSAHSPVRLHAPFYKLLVGIHFCSQFIDREFQKKPAPQASSHRLSDCTGNAYRGHIEWLANSSIAKKQGFDDIRICNFLDPAQNRKQQF
jgi:hypothetical protein